MALQGTLDTFGLADVLRLLAATRKTGRLRVRTGRTAGDLWLVDGAVVASAAPDIEADPVQVVFELLRSPEGTFDFVTGEEAGSATGVEPVDDLLARAEAMLAEWREIERVVPSMDAWVSLSDELPGAKLSITAAQWRGVAAIGHGEPVAAVARALGLGDLDACALVLSLVHAGLAVVAPVWDPTYESDGHDPEGDVVRADDIDLVEAAVPGGEEPFDRDALLRVIATVR